MASNQQLAFNGNPVPATNGLVEIGYVNHVLWRRMDDGNWYSEGVTNGQPATLSGPTATSPFPATTGIPQPAVDAGYTTIVLDDDFLNTSTVQMASGGSGYNWWNYQPDTNNATMAFNPTNASSGAYYVDPSGTGTIIIQAAGVFNANLCTTNKPNQLSGQPVSTPSNHVFSGPRLFVYGYFRCRMKFGAAISGTGYPSWWMTALGTDANPHCEFDVVELNGNATRGLVLPGLIQWNPTNTAYTQEWVTNQTPPNYTALSETMLNMSDFNWYDMLWTPTKWEIYFNGVLMLSFPTTTPIALGANIRTGGTTAVTDTLTGANNTHAYLLFGTGGKQAVLVDRIQVYQ